MRKIFTMLAICVMGAVAVACNKTQAPVTTTAAPVTRPTVNCEVNPDHPDCGGGVRTTTTQEKKVYNPLGYDGEKATITILTGNVLELDPYDPGFTGNRTKERQQLQDDLEAAYNVEIEYKMYGADAAWGPSRVNAIIDSVNTKKPLGQVYFIDSSWIPQLVKGNAIAPLNSPMSDREFALATPLEQATSVKNKIYGMSTAKGEVLDGIFINNTLRERLNLEDPAELFLKDEWTYTKFFEYVAQAKAALGTGEFVVTGHPQDYAFGFAGTLGGTYISSTTQAVTLASSGIVQAYQHVANLKDYWDEKEHTDAGSENWRTGKVLFSTGSTWFLNSKDRWLDIREDLNLGYVPFPIQDNSTKDSYRSLYSSDGVFAVSEGFSDNVTKKGLSTDLIFNVLHDILTGLTETETYEDAFRLSMEKIFNSSSSVDAIWSIQGKTVECDIVKSVGVGSYDATYGLYPFASKVLKGDIDILATLQSFISKYEAEKNNLYS